MIKCLLIYQFAFCRMIGALQRQKQLKSRLFSLLVVAYCLLCIHAFFHYDCWAKHPYHLPMWQAKSFLSSIFLYSIKKEVIKYTLPKLMLSLLLILWLQKIHNIPTMISCPDNAQDSTENWQYSVNCNHILQANGVVNSSTGVNSRMAYSVSARRIFNKKNIASLVMH